MTLTIGRRFTVGITRQHFYAQVPRLGECFISFARDGGPAGRRIVWDRCAEK